jgi:hypothetical protein
LDAALRDVGRAFREREGEEDLKSNNLEEMDQMIP